MAGTQVHLIDPLQQRQSIADIFGCHFATPEQAGAEFDCVIHASGHAEGLSLALRLAGFEAQVLELSWYGTQSVTLSLGEDFHARRLNVRSSQVGTIAQAQRSRWSHQRRMELVMTLLADQRLDALLDQTSQFEDLPHTMSALATSSSAGLCHRVIYEHQ
jgi:threonine dehydrogenase-like Zn-dependent dehydrogenase